MKKFSLYRTFGRLSAVGGTLSEGELALSATLVVRGGGCYGFKGIFSRSRNRCMAGLS